MCFVKVLFYEQEHREILRLGKDFKFSVSTEKELTARDIKKGFFRKHLSDRVRKTGVCCQIWSRILRYVFGNRKVTKKMIYFTRMAIARVLAQSGRFKSFLLKEKKEFLRVFKKSSDARNRESVLRETLI